jgi:hypothetical protein
MARRETHADQGVAMSETADMTIKAVIETAIYVDDLDRAEVFYRGIL